MKLAFKLNNVFVISVKTLNVLSFYVPGILCSITTM